MTDPAPQQPETVDSAPSAPLTVPGSATDTPAAEAAPPPRTVAYRDENAGGETVALPNIPGYVILDVLGRGGMGVVYRARETALDRLVALKVVTAGAHASAEQLARFRNEARAEARLQHPHIVQVHAVGEHNGCPYLSLEYVDGGSLAQRLARQPQAPCQAAQLVFLLARAMTHAHQHGVIHRDLKPANILLQRRAAADTSQQNTKEKTDRSASSTSAVSHTVESLDDWLEAVPKIADFGLAKCLEEESGQTRTGSFLGTPNYVAPEQAEGRKDVGPATDVWALGIILYELLVGRTPFSGVTMIDTLEQVRVREAVPPTQLQPKIPIDLETICLKCLHKEIDQRYASAEALADDLRRFLDGEPILARPIGPLGRWLRWSRRNPRLAVLSAAVLLLLLTVAVTSTTFVFVLESRRREIESAWKQARLNEETARKNEEIARKHAETARNEQQRADDNAREAQQRYQLLRETLLVVIDKVQNELRAVPSTAKARREIVAAAMDVLRKSVAQGRDSTRHPERALASSYVLMGYILEEQKQIPEAIKHFNEAHNVLETLYRANPDNDKAAGNYAASLSIQGDLALKYRNNPAEAQRLYRQALSLQEKSLNQRPAKPELTPTEIRRSLANSHQHLGEILLRSPQPNRDEVREHFEKARRLLEQVVEAEDAIDNHVRLQRVCEELGQVNERMNRSQDAVAAYEVCLQERKKLAADFPADLHLQMEMLRMYGKVGDLHLFMGHTDTARRFYQEVIASNEALTKRDGSPNLRMILSLNYYRLATAFLRQREQGQADAFYRKCLDVRLALQRQYPGNLNLDIDVMIAQGRCGRHREAAAFAGRLRERFPNDPAKLLHAACGYALCAYGVAAGKTEDALTAEERRLRQGYNDRAIETLRQAKKNGYKDVKNLQTEPDLDAVRGDKKFQALLREFVTP